MAASAHRRPTKGPWTPFLLLLLILTSIAARRASGAGVVGVNWGELADNLPPPTQVVELLKAQGIQHVKMFFSTPALLQALAGSGITVMVGIPNTAITAIASNVSEAVQWLQENVVAYPNTNITYIAVGNEVLTASRAIRGRLVRAVNNMYAALQTLNLHLKVKVSSPMALNILNTSYPPSAGTFTPAYADTVLRPLLEFYNRTGAGFIANAYPFFSYVGDTAEIPLAYATFQPNAGVLDPATGLHYDNLFVAQLDATFSAMSALGYDNVDIIVGETGWPSVGDATEPGCTIEIASAFNRGLVQYVQSGVGTPLRPNASVDSYIFALFNEDLKKGKISERNYGLFYPNGQPVYTVDFHTPIPPPLSSPPALPPSPPESTLSPPPNPPASSPILTPPSPILPPPSPTLPPPSPILPPPAASPQNSWCVAVVGADPITLQQALDWACGQGGANCAPLQADQPCFLPNTLTDHASYAFNDYYQRNARAGGSCYFGSTAYVTSQDPSYNDCKFPV